MGSKLPKSYLSQCLCSGDISSQSAGGRLGAGAPEVTQQEQLSRTQRMQGSLKSHVKGGMGTDNKEP